MMASQLLATPALMLGAGKALKFAPQANLSSIVPVSTIAIAGVNYVTSVLSRK
jgi:hypothetical protein